MMNILYNLGALFLSFLFVAMINGALEGWQWIGPMWIRLPFGLTFMAAGIVVRVLATMDFHRHQLALMCREPQKTLCVTGIYRFSRNPLYFGLLLMFTGSSIAIGSLCSIIVAIIYTVMVHMYVVLYEEPSLKKEFGQDYLHYQACAPRWFGRVQSPRLLQRGDFCYNT